MLVMNRQRLNNSVLLKMRIKGIPNLFTKSNKRSELKVNYALSSSVKDSSK